MNKSNEAATKMTPAKKYLEEDNASPGVLGPIIKESSVFLGGSSMGKGFRRAARFYLRKEAPSKISKAIMSASASATNDGNGGGASLLNPGVEHRVEEPFYVVDIGMVVSQYYQWKQFFPRVEVFYAVKCNPDPVVVKTLVALGANFDCASRAEMRLVQEISDEASVSAGAAGDGGASGGKKKPEIIYANPCKARSHIIEAVCRNVTLMTFDNIAEVRKCASISAKIRLILRIITDDSGSQCRLSSKFGAPKSRWRDLLSAAKAAGLEVVGVSFHVGSGCRDASRYEMALRDARELFDIGEAEFGFKMTLLDIGGGFPGETHSLWNPSSIFGDPTADTDTTEIARRKYTIDEEIDGLDDEESRLGDDVGEDEEADADAQFMFFSEIAEQIVPIIDELFPLESGVRIIAEPGRYLVAASVTLCASVVSVRSNATDATVSPPLMISDEQAAFHVDQITRAEEDSIVADQSKPAHPVIDSIVDEIADYSRLFARLNLSQQEFDVYAHNAELTSGHVEPGAHLLAPPEERLPEGEAPQQHHTVEGMQMGIVADCFDDALSVVSETEVSEEGGALRSLANKGALSLAAGGEAAISGVVIQAIADSAPRQDDYAYYINDGCYGGFNNLIFDHATVRPRRLKHAIAKSHKIIQTERDGFTTLEAVESDDSSNDSNNADDGLYPSTVFGPTCDSIDVISRSVLLPKLGIGDWLYFQNMGAYTMAAASDFNGFSPTEKFYVCSVQPEHFEKFAEKSSVDIEEEEKKDSL